MAVPNAADSVVVNTLPQARHLRRRQVLLARLCWRELMTSVAEAQYIHTMTTYCHAASKKASGKARGLLWICGRKVVSSQ